MTTHKKLIEVALPLEAINVASAREKSIRHGHPSTLHLWWARRPLAAARAVIFAQMVDDPSAYLDDLLNNPAKVRDGQKRLAVERERWETRRAVYAASPDTEPEPGPEPTVEECVADIERLRLFAIIEKLVLWENTTNQAVLAEARAEILASWRRTCARNADHPRAAELFDPETPPGFHDPFAGGGALPLEAQRLGLEAWASDLNPVAVLINKAMIEIPPKFAGRAPVSRPDDGGSWPGASGLAEDVRHYGKWMRDEAEKRIGHLYPKVAVTSEMAVERPDLKPYVGRELTVIAWLWARTVQSPNPAFAGVDVPLASTFLLSTKPGKEAYVEPVIEGRGYRFTVKVGKPKDPEKVKAGTKLGRGANFQCVLSGSPISPDYIKAEGIAKRMGSRLMAVVAEGDRGRVYLAPTPEMENTALMASPEWTPETPLPDDPRNFWTVSYGLTSYGDLFTPRQLVALTTFSDLVQEAREKVKADALAAGLTDDNEGFIDNNTSLTNDNASRIDRNASRIDDNTDLDHDSTGLTDNNTGLTKDGKGLTDSRTSLTNGGRGLAAGGTGATAYADAAGVYLGLAISKLADAQSSLCRWKTTMDQSIATFGRQALPMVWDYSEANAFGEMAGDPLVTLKNMMRVLDQLTARPIGIVRQQDAQNQTLTSAKVVSTDPPYYDNIGYADLSDFFYVWLRRSLRPIFPELFATMAVPKAEELVATPYRHGSKDKAEKFFLDGMTQAMSRLAEQAHPTFPITIYYAFKQSETESAGTASTGWETFLAAVIKAGFALTGTWPMRTELANRMIGSGTNALASSIVLVCRKQSPDARPTTRREFVNALKAELPAALAKMQQANIAPVDLAQASIGPGMGVYTRYTRVLDAEGKPLTVRQALALINEVLDEALAEQEGDFDPDTRWALAWFDQFGFNDGPYGTAETLSKAKNTAVGGLVEAGIAVSGTGRVRLLRPAELPADWNPETDKRLTVWEVVHQLIRALETGGEGAAAALQAKLGSRAEVARELAYRLYTLCERKKRANEALAYNALVQSWTEMSRLAGEQQQAKRQPTQGAMDFTDDEDGA